MTLYSLDVLLFLFGTSQITPYSGLYIWHIYLIYILAHLWLEILFSRSIGASQVHSLNINCRVWFCCTCHLQSGSPFFVYFGFLCSKIFWCLISGVWGGEGGLLFRFICSLVLWGGRNTANKYHWHVWGVLTMFGPHWVCTCSWHVRFPGLHCSGSRLLCRGTLSSGPWVACTSQV